MAAYIAVDYSARSNPWDNPHPSFYFVIARFIRAIHPPLTRTLRCLLDASHKAGHDKMGNA
jgi:hypothetical protein